VDLASEYRRWATMTIILRLVVGLIFGTATYAISTSSNPNHEAYLIYAAVVVAATAAWQIYIAIGSWLAGEPRRSRDLVAAMANRYVEMYDMQRMLREDVTKISFHVGKFHYGTGGYFRTAFAKS
jgi:hypothetical protein